MKISVILPHLKLYGGVKRFLEIGNEMVIRGYDYTIYHSDGSPPDWFKYNGKLSPIENVHSVKHEVLMCGDAPSLDIFDRCNAQKKFVFIIFPYTRRYGIGTYDIKSDYILIGVSNGWEKRFPQKFNNKGYTISGGVNLEQFYPVEVEKDDKFRVLIYAKFDRGWKNTGNIVKALELVKDPPVLMLYDVQKWKYDTPLEIEHYVNPPQDSLREMYSKADIFISAEGLAGWCNTAAEAMACGTPVICTSAGTTNFAINNETALVIPDVNPETIARFYSILKNNGELRVILSRSGLVKIKQFSWQKFCDGLEEALKREVSLKSESHKELYSYLKNKELFNHSVKKVGEHAYEEKFSHLRDYQLDSMVSDIIKIMEV